MSKITKNQRIETLEQIAVDQSSAFKIMADRLKSIEVESKWIIHMTGIETPQLKTLDQSVFNNMHERWKFAAVDADGHAHRFNKEVSPFGEGFCYEGCEYSEFKFSLIGTGYDASNWQNSLIERDIAKELLEVDLSSELTGSELCKAMLARGDKYVMCKTNDNDFIVISGTYEADDDNDAAFVSTSGEYTNVIPINNQGEPLTAAEVGL